VENNFSKEVTFHINNMAYTISVNENMFKEIKKYLNIEKNNDTKDLLVAYLHLSQDYHLLKQDVQNITEKLSRF
jgi:hypothetical protein